LTVGSEYVVIGPMVLSLDTCGLGLVSFGLGLGLGLEPSGFVNITAGRFGPASGRTDAFCATRSPTPGAAGRADSEYAECDTNFNCIA